MEKVYPQVCKRCKPLVASKLNAVSSRVKSLIFNSVLKNSTMERNASILKALDVTLPLISFIPWAFAMCILFLTNVFMVGYHVYGVLYPISSRYANYDLSESCTITNMQYDLRCFYHYVYQFVGFSFIACFFNPLWLKRYNKPHIVVKHKFQYLVCITFLCICLILLLTLIFRNCS